jgi:parallel beta-helix repeat protein
MGTADNNVIRDNEVDRAKLYGIVIDEAAPGSLVERNVVLGAGDDGIDVESPTTTLTRNRASGNGNPAQCQGVACS